MEAERRCETNGAGLLSARAVAVVVVVVVVVVGAGLSSARAVVVVVVVVVGAGLLSARAVVVVVVVVVGAGLSSACPCPCCSLLPNSPLPTPFPRTPRSVLLVTNSYLPLATHTEQGGTRLTCQTCQTCQSPDSFLPTSYFLLPPRREELA
eukprot:5308214-Prymnesium_polylepis.1